MQPLVSRQNAPDGWRLAASLLLALTGCGLAAAQESLPRPPLAGEGIEEVAAPEADYSGQELVVEVRIVGNDTVPTAKVEGQLTTRAGRPFDIAVVNRDVRRLANVGWFVDVKPKSVKTPQGRIVVFEVTERPTIRYVEYIGNNRFSDKTLGKQTLLKVGGSVDPQSVQEGRRKIREYYQGKGYNNVQVTVLEGSQVKDKGVVYLINEGAAQKIQKVEFVGNEFVSAGRLRKAVVKSKPPILMMFKGYVDLEKIQADVDVLTAYYRSYGYFQARVGRKIEYDEANKWAVLTFVINEGPRYNVRNVRFNGNSKFDGVAMTEQAKVQDGQPFEQAKMRETADWLQELYGSRGYVFADVKPETIFLEEPGQVDLVYHIEEGKQWRVGRIFVHIGGDNPHTRIQTALNRVTLRPGEIMDIRELKASERRLQASSLYHVDAATGQKPKITYKIPEEYDLAAAEYSGGMRGQSVASAEPFPATPVLPPPSAAELTAPTQAPVYAAAPAAVPRPAPDGADMHVFCDDFEHYLRWVEAEETESDMPATSPSVVVPASYESPAAPQPRPTSLPPTATEPIFRGQSPVTAPRTDLFWVQPRTAYHPTTPQPQQQAPQAAAAQSPAHRPPATNTTAWHDSPPPAQPQYAPGAYSQFAAPAQYGLYDQAPMAAPTSPTAPTWPAAPSIQAPANQFAANPAPFAPVVANTAGGGNPYQQVRGQSPAPAAQGAYTQLGGGAQQPQNAYTAVAGGQSVQPTGPSSAPIYYDPQVQPAQYSSQINPPAGSISPTPLSPQGPLPGYILFPDGRYGPAGQPYSDQAVDIFIEGTETQTGRLQMGVGVNSDAGVVGNFVIDERNFNWRRWPSSFEDVRNGTAFRGDGQRLRIEASPGSQVNRYLISFTQPYFLDRPIILGLSGSFFDRRYRDWDEQRLGGRVSLGYQWVERDLSASLTYRGENVNIHDPSVPLGTLQDLDDVLGDNAIHGFGVTVINDTRDNAFLPTQGYYAQITGEQVIGTFDYPRVIADFRKYWMITERPDHSGRQVLSYSTTVGYTGTHTPIFERFFAGGFATMRGFDFRGASPIRSNVEVGGDFQWLNSVQYLFPITADDMLHGVVFCDFGTVEETVTIKDFRVAPGAGLRITVPAMGPAPIALDFAWAVNEAAFDDKQVFSFSVGFSR
ncbi:MAG: BamA/TamA family outer membrane protein [Pirellulales bacterium]|nr:BamA/TamA family outer membrane protein [Pirellulales bacterium]